MSASSSSTSCAVRGSDVVDLACKHSRYRDAVSSISLRLPYLLSSIKGQAQEAQQKRTPHAVGTSHKKNSGEAQRRMTRPPAGVVAATSCALALSAATGLLMTFKAGVLQRMLKRGKPSGQGRSDATPKRSFGAVDEGADGGGSRQADASTAEILPSPKHEEIKAEPPGTPQDCEGRPTRALLNLSPDLTPPNVGACGAGDENAVQHEEVPDTTGDNDAMSEQSGGEDLQSISQKADKRSEHPPKGEEEQDTWHAAKKEQPMVSAGEGAQPNKISASHAGETAAGSIPELAGGTPAFRPDAEARLRLKCPAGGPVAGCLSTVDEKPQGKSVEEPSSESDSEQRPKRSHRQIIAGDNVSRSEDPTVPKLEEAPSSGQAIPSGDMSPHTSSRRRSLAERVSARLKPSPPWKY